MLPNYNCAIQIFYIPPYIHTCIKDTYRTVHSCFIHNSKCGSHLA